MNAWRRARDIQLIVLALSGVVMLVAAVALAVKMIAMERRIDEGNAALDAALDRRNAAISSLISAVGERERILNTPPTTELGLALQGCSEDLGGFSSVERDPCRLVCTDYGSAAMIDIIELSESVCRSLP